ncbi:hypothetical protein HYDPIDRAFT_29559 [Hydnomerulius pinastri MD-312]|uniref:Uncharacterized protein n=1 Tax=Hydnomerulius pinastri MD-312 TaxID=994086 RepID=A0A0C9WDR9_9AGAM|nr:hypothetical protein HYDPIDRAFT_29559 [Hydnomerulius pinastri MD-312]
MSVQNGTSMANVTVDASQCYDDNYARKPHRHASRLPLKSNEFNCSWRMRLDPKLPCVDTIRSGITMYFVNAGPQGINAGFSVDNGQPVINTLQPAPPPNFQQANVSMFSVHSLPTGYHTLLMNVLEWDGSASWIMFDYALVNETLVSNTTTSSSSTSSSQAPTGSPTSPSSAPKFVLPLKGGTLAGIAGIAAIVFGVLYLRKRRSVVAEREERLQVDPFMSGPSTSNAPSVVRGKLFSVSQNTGVSASPQSRSAILRDEPIAENHQSKSNLRSLTPSSSSSAVRSGTSQPPGGSTSSPRVFQRGVPSPFAGIHGPVDLAVEDLDVLERLRSNNFPAETIARVAESLAGRYPTNMSGGNELVRGASLMTAAAPPSYETG